jgi:bacillithiol system protein YtxJ
MVKECKTLDDFREILSDSNDKAVFVLKHSTACSVSRIALKEYTSFASRADQAEYRQVLVRENRALSDLIAEETGIKHESPQVILFYRGKPAWICTHRSITTDSLGRQLERMGLE